MKTTEINQPGYYFVSRAPNYLPTAEIARVVDGGNIFYITFTYDDHLYTPDEFHGDYPLAVWSGPIPVPAREEMA